MSSPAALTDGPRSHVLTHRDIIAPGEAYEAPLPATGKELTFSLPTGPKPPEDWQATLILGLESPDTTAPAVTLNGRPSPACGRWRSDMPCPPLLRRDGGRAAGKRSAADQSRFR
jgi:hypothetical protein